MSNDGRRRQTEKKLTEGVVAKKYKSKMAPSGDREIVYDPSKPKGKRIVGQMRASTAVRRGTDRNPGRRYH